MIKKILIALGAFIVLSISTAYIFLFTSFGNGFVSNFIEDTVNAKAPINFKMEEFVLTFNKLNVKASVDATSVVEISGDISPISLEFDLKYLVDIKDLSKLEPFINQKLQGDFRTNGEVKGNKDLLLVNGLTDVFNSSSKYDVVLKNFVVTNIDLLFKNINIDRILYTLNQPLFVTGMIDIKGNVTDITLENLAGNVVTTIYDGKLNNPILNENFNLKLLGEKVFSGEIETFLKPMLIDNKIDFKTSFANVEVQSAKVDLKNIYINSDYKVIVEDLNNLFDLTQMKLKGNITLNGEFSKTKDLELTGNSNTLGGAVDFRLLNDDFNANMKNLKVLEITKMLIYPDFFDSEIHGIVDYNLASQQGAIKANLIDGKFLQNRFTFLIDKAIKGELSKEVYEDFELNSQIDKKIIQTQVLMTSSNSSVDVKNSILNLENQTVDAEIDLKVDKYELSSKITGPINKPDIQIDTSKLIKDIAKDRLEKELDKIKEKDENKGKLIDGIKSIFGN